MEWGRCAALEAKIGEIDGHVQQCDARVEDQNGLNISQHSTAPIPLSMFGGRKWQLNAT